MTSRHMLMASMNSCRRRGEKWFVAMNKWQDITDMEVSKGGSEMTVDRVPDGEQIGIESLDMLSEHCRQVEGIGYKDTSDACLASFSSMPRMSRDYAKGSTETL